MTQIFGAPSPSIATSGALVSGVSRAQTPSLSLASAAPVFPATPFPYDGPFAEWVGVTMPSLPPYTRLFDPAVGAAAIGEIPIPELAGDPEHAALDEAATHAAIAHDHGTPPQGPIDPAAFLRVTMPQLADRGPDYFASPPRALLAVDAPTSKTRSKQKPVKPPVQPARENNAYVPKAGDLLPDLRPLFPNEIGIVTREGAKALAFNSTWQNQGQGPLELRFQPGTNTGVRQIVHTSNGKTRAVESKSEFLFDNRVDHQHTHLNDFARYELFKANRDGTVGERVRNNDKVSFYITDTHNMVPRADPSGISRVDRSTRNDDAVQGISVGWADTYGAALQGQSFAVRGLAPGQYVLRMTFDPNDRIAETDETNNVFDTLVTIGNSGNVKPIAIGAPRTPGGRPIRGNPGAARLPYGES